MIEGCSDIIEGTSIFAEKLETYSKYEIPVLVLNVNGREERMINFANNYYTLFPNIEPNPSRQVLVESTDGNPYEIIQTLLSKNGYGNDFEFSGNFKLIIDYMNLTVKFYRLHTVLKYIDNSKGFLKAVIANDDSYLELLPDWSYDGINLGIKGYGNALRVKESHDGELLSGFSVSKKFGFNLDIKSKYNKFHVDPDSLRVTTTKHGLKFYRVNLGEIDLAFWTGTKHYSLPQNKWFVMLLKNNKILDYKDLSNK